MRIGIGDSERVGEWIYGRPVFEDQALVGVGESRVERHHAVRSDCVHVTGIWRIEDYAEGLGLARRDQDNQSLPMRVICSIVVM